MATILIIEAHMPDLEKLNSALMTLGHVVAPFNAAAGALREATHASQPYELVLIGDQLSNVIGPGIIRELRNETAYSATPVIASSDDTSLWGTFKEDPQVHPMVKPIGPAPDYKALWNINAAVALVGKLLSG